MIFYKENYFFIKYFEVGVLSLGGSL